MAGLVLGAVLLGVIIAVVEEDEFPGVGRMMLCVLAAVVPAALLRYVLPGGLSFLGTLFGAACAAVAIALLCRMTLRRAAIAAATYSVRVTAVSWVFGL
jgi:hypothetical protein